MRADRRRIKSQRLSAFVGGFFVLCALSFGQEQAGRFLHFDEVREVLESFSGSGLPGSDIHQQKDWDAWIRRHDREVRSRIDRGTEDSISNLILYGTSYTRLPRLEGAESATTDSGQLTEAAQARVQAFSGALAGNIVNERLAFAKDFIARLKVPAAAVESYLSENLRRFSLEQRAYQDKLRDAGKTGDAGAVLFARGTLYEQRGLSVDTSLLPNFAIEDSLAALVKKNVLAPGCIRNVAIIGPGLDFTDKRDGYEFYPLQTLQPFAVLEAVLRLKLAEPDQVAIATFELSPAVNAHLARLLARTRSGVPYVIQLPRDPEVDWRPEAVSYWNRFGEMIGSPARPAPLPAALSGLMLRAVAIQPRFAARLRPFDIDIVAQTMDRSEGRGFDLVVATNVLVYYDRLEQALAMTSIAHMMNAGTVFLANHVLPAQHPRELEYLGRRSISYSASGAFGDDVVVYRRTR